MRQAGGRTGHLTGALALAAWLAAAPAQAQSVGDYRLPGATQTPNPRNQGPVDSDNPVVVGPSPRPSPSAAPTPAQAAPIPQPSVTPPPVSTPARSAPSVSPRFPASSGQTTSVPTPAPATASPIPQAPATLPLPTASGPEKTEPDPRSTPPQVPDRSWLWLAGAAGLLVVLTGLAWWYRRRGGREPVVDFEPPVVARPEPVPPPAPALAPEAAAIADPAIATTPHGLEIALDAQRMSASLMATTLSYSLTLTNHSNQPLGALAIEGDMVAAHASLPPERQMASDHQRLELRHALVELAPGTSAEFRGEFRLPLTAITPIRAGDAAYFVPLVRLRVEASLPGGQSLIEVQTFVIGESPEDPTVALRPFRLDLGPRVYQRVGQRAVG